MISTNRTFPNDPRSQIDTPGRTAHFTFSMLVSSESLHFFSPCGSLSRLRVKVACNDDQTLTHSLQNRPLVLSPPDTHFLLLLQAIVATRVHCSPPLRISVSYYLVRGAFFPSVAPVQWPISQRLVVRDEERSIKMERVREIIEIWHQVLGR